MKKIISMILVLFSTLVLAVEPKPGVNFKTTKNVSFEKHYAIKFES